MGPLEPVVTDCYRLLFFDMAAFARELCHLSTPRRVLEVGCGEGALVTHLARLWPAARIDGIDLTSRLGRMYRGDRARVRFQRLAVEDFAAADPGGMDLVVLCDVLHHIPWDRHPGIFAAAARVLRPGGLVVVKEWVRDGNPAYWLGYFSDRYITGDRIRYGTREEWVQALRAAFGPSALQREFAIAPWSCNRAFVLLGKG